MTDRKKTSVALGFFDGMHIGHQAVINAACAAAQKDGLIPAAFMIREKPLLPKFGSSIDIFITPYDKKVRLLEKRFGIRKLYAPFFDEIKELSPETFFGRDVIGVLNAGYVVCGEDFRFGKDRSGDPTLLASLCEKAGIGFEAVPPVCVDGEKVSSTALRELIRAGDLETANSLMLDPLSYTLPVLHGRKLGRTIGFPTINQEIPPFMVHPKRGVYASTVTLDGREYPAITNIGVKPTVKDDDSENTETHIIGFDGDLYGKNVCVTLRRFMRDERKFGSLEELQRQLDSDKKAALSQL